MEKATTLTGWDNEKRPVQAGYSPETVQEFCVRNQDWQQVRLSMKGKPTHEKLVILEAWWERHLQPNNRVRYQCEVQVGNYLGALRRGGQLDANNQIRKYI